MSTGLTWQKLWSRDRFEMWTGSGPRSSENRKYIEFKNGKRKSMLTVLRSPEKKFRILYIVVDSNALYIFFVPDWDSECWPNLDPDPSVMLAI